MLTIFCSPKPFKNEADWNQRNAMRSWKEIHPDVEIFVFGTAFGSEDAVAEIGAILVPEIESSPSGAPSFNAMQRYVTKNGQYDLQVYVNCDILLNATLLKAMIMSHKHFERFLIVGERLDLSQGTTIDVRHPAWADALVPMAKNGRLIAHGPTGVDYFGFVREAWDGLPPIYMGRALCDQALLHHCLKERIPIIDASQAVMAIHQFHDYWHVPGGKQEVFGGKDLSFMAKEHRLYHSLPTITDADLRFGEDGWIIQGRRQKLRQWELALRYRYCLNHAALLLRAIQYLGGKRHLYPTRISINDILISWFRFLEAN